MQAEKFNLRLRELIDFLGYTQTQMGERLGVSRNLVSMMARDEKPVKPSRTVQMLFTREWEQAKAGTHPGRPGARLGLDQPVGPPQPGQRGQTAPPERSIVREEESVPYRAGPMPSREEMLRYLYGCEALLLAIPGAASPEEHAFAVHNFDSAWNRYKTLANISTCNPPQYQAESHGYHPSWSQQTPPTVSTAASASSAPQLPPPPAPLPANLVKMPPQHFMSEEEVRARGIVIPGNASNKGQQHKRGT